METVKPYTGYGKKENLQFESKAVHGALGYEPSTGSVSFPIYQTSTFRHKELGVSTGFDYSRLQNPTRQELERTIAILENGLEGFALSSGQAANLSIFTWLNPGDHVLISNDIYGGTFRIAEDIFVKYGVAFTYVEMSDLNAVKAAVTSQTRMFFIETPTNPLMKVADIAAISGYAKSIGVITVVDNTFLTPYFQKPLDLGADVVVHSGTKYLGGHNDTMAGLVVVKSQEMADHMRLQLKTQGNGLAALDSWLILRGLKTLHLRMERHNQNAYKTAHWLRKHPLVKKVYYVGFENHPGYEITKKQTAGFGGMISFTVNSEDTVKRILKNVDMIMFAESLGGTETLITYPTTQTHESIPEDIKQKLGITREFLRMSVGLEHADDIIRDLNRAMDGREL